MKTRRKAVASGTHPDVPPVREMELHSHRLPSGAVVTFIDIEQSGMHIARTLEEKDALAGGGSVQGAYVKVQPTIRASERASLDTKTVRQQLLDAGAVAVVVAPVVVPDAKTTRSETRTAPKAVHAETYLKAWFQTAKGARRVVERAIGEAMSSIGEAGL